MSHKGWSGVKNGDNLSRARMYVKQWAPYFGPTIYGMIPTPYPGLIKRMGGPLAVTDRLVLLYEPEWVAEVSTIVLATGLAHEAMHDQLRHVQRGLAYPDKQRFNRAGDLFINGLQKNQTREVKSTTGGGNKTVPMWDLPEWTLHPEQYGFEEGLSADTYYKLLTEYEKKHPPPPRPPDMPFKIMCGHCGGVAGNPVGNVEQEFNELKGRSELECKSIARSTAKHIQEYMNGPGRGNSPGDWSSLIDIAEESYHVPWTSILPNIVRAQVGDIRLGGQDYSMRRPSTRSYLRGWPLPGLVGYDPEICFVIDSSGSMGRDAQLPTALRLIADVLEQMGIQSAWVLEADAGVQRAPRKVTTSELMSYEIKGGGGTDFAPALKYMQTFEPAVGLVFYLTDGDGAAPREAPEEFHTVWVVVPSQWGRKPAEWGTLVVVDDSERALSPAIRTHLPEEDEDEEEEDDE